MSIISSQIGEFLILLEQKVANAEQQDFDQILNELLSISYYLLDKLEQITIETNFKIQQLEQQIEFLKDEIDKQIKVAEEYNNKYSEQLQYNYILELNYCKMEQQCKSTNQDLEESKEKEINNKLYLLSQNENLRKQLYNIEKSKYEINLLLVAQIEKNKQLEMEIEIYKEKDNQKKINFEKSQKTIQKLQSLEQETSVQNIIQTIHDFFDDQKYMQQEKLCCYPSLNQIGNSCVSLQQISCKSLHYLADELPTYPKFNKQSITICNNPYHIFFKLIIQCVKLDLQKPQYFEINLDYYYDSLISNKIPFNRWYQQIKIHLENLQKSK